MPECSSVVAATILRAAAQAVEAGGRAESSAGRAHANAVCPAAAGRVASIGVVRVRAYAHRPRRRRRRHRRTAHTWHTRNTVTFASSMKDSMVCRYRLLVPPRSGAAQDEL